MRKDKEKAIAMRKAGASYKEISEKLSVSKSTLSNWFSSEQWSNSVKERLSEQNRKAASKRMKQIAADRNRRLCALYSKRRKEAQKIFSAHKHDPLFVAGLMIYWGEGDSKLENGYIRVGNTDPDMLAIYKAFLFRFLPDAARKIRVYLVLYKDIDEQKAVNYWSKSVEIDVDKFYKSTYIDGRHPSRRLTNGICTLSIASREYKEMIDEWILLYKKNRDTLAGIV